MEIGDALRKRLLYWEVSVEDIRKATKSWKPSTFFRLSAQGNIVAQCALQIIAQDIDRADAVISPV